MYPHLNPKKKTTQAHIQKETPITINYISSSPKLNIIVKKNCLKYLQCDVPYYLMMSYIK